MDKSGGSNPFITANSRQEISAEEITFSEGPSKREKCLMIICVVLFVIAVIFLILFIVFYLESQDKEKEIVKQEDVCNSLDCLQTAFSISKDMDVAVDPCDDFYQFACGKWADNHPIPPNNYYWDNMQEATRKMKLTGRDLLEAQDTSALDAIQKARDFYKSCANAEILDVNTQEINQKGTALWLKLLRSKGANLFPILDGVSWVDEGWTPSEILARVPKHPYFLNPMLVYTQPIISFGVDVDPMNANKIILAVDQPPDYEQIRQLLQSAQSGLAMLRKAQFQMYALALGASHITLEDDAQKVLDFEIGIARATSPPPVNTSAFTKMTLRQLSERYPKFDWLDYAQRELSSVGMNVTEDEEVMTKSLSYFDEIMSMITSTPRRTLLNYCFWTIIQGYKSFTSSDTDRKESCATFTNFYFPDTVGRLFVDKHFSERTKTQLEALIVDLKDAFRGLIRGADWMSEPTRQAALEKVDFIINKIGYSEVLKNDTYLNEKTQGIVINETDILESAVNAGEHMHKTLLRSVGQPYDRQRWVTLIAIVNAFYNPQTNSIILPAGFLQEPIYMEKVLDVLTYGGVGFFIGHEITHGFDNTGADFDKVGALKNWWKPEDLEEFDRRGECMVEQYSEFRFPEVNMTLDGRKTLGENIADNGGLKIAYWAYKKMINDRGKEDPKLPVLSYTPDQLFFIGMAQYWCSNQKSNYISLALQSAHPPNKFRVNGAMQNNLEFAETFSCPVGSYMNPVKKCHVW